MKYSKKVMIIVVVVSGMVQAAQQELPSLSNLSLGESFQATIDDIHMKLLESISDAGMDKESKKKDCDKCLKDIIAGMELKAYENLLHLIATPSDNFFKFFNTPREIGLYKYKFDKEDLLFFQQNFLMPFKDYCFDEFFEFKASDQGRAGLGNLCAWGEEQIFHSGITPSLLTLGWSMLRRADKNGIRVSDLYEAFEGHCYLREVLNYEAREELRVAQELLNKVSQEAQDALVKKNQAIIERDEAQRLADRVGMAIEFSSGVNSKQFLEESRKQKNDHMAKVRERQFFIDKQIEKISQLNTKCIKYRSLLEKWKKRSVPMAVENL